MKISLFIPYFTPDSLQRRAELEACLERNKSNAEIDSIYLIVDEPQLGILSDERVTTLTVNSRPTYMDWVQLSYQHAPEGVSVLANADIYFFDDIKELAQILAADPTGFVAMSRYDYQNGELERHPNPHWSQDTWAFYPSRCANQSRDAQLNFPLGVPRCDNKVAYVFSVYGHNIYNPCNFIKSVHVHESGVRSYSKKGDMRIVGGMAMIHPSESVVTPARLDIEVWPVKTENFQSLTLNKSLAKWAQELNLDTPVTEPLGVISRMPSQRTAPVQAAATKESGALFEGGNVVGFDAYWQHPAITEQHAFDRMKLLAPQTSEMAYLGFPWASYIDICNHNKKDEERKSILRAGLKKAVHALKGYGRISTVCQHIHMKQYASIFAEAGVTDIFWSHAVQGEHEVPEYKGLKIHPFPLFPVQLCDPPLLSYAARRYLFSFVGAKASPIYLSQARTYIIEELASHPQGLIRERDTWHYNKIVYDSQVLNRVSNDGSLVDEAASLDFKDVMRQSVFTLCPSGTGPNSIRLWEAISSDSIPVVMSETYRWPGSDSLWDEAIVHCEEDRDAINELPARLSDMMRDAHGLLKRKAALRMLALRYGRSGFVSDIVSLMISSSVEKNQNE